MAKNIKKRSDDYAQWYLDVIKAAKLADYAPVRGAWSFGRKGIRSGKRFSGNLIDGSKRRGM